MTSAATPASGDQESSQLLKMSQMPDTFFRDAEVPLCLSFSGSGFLATYQLGVVQSLLDNAPWVLRCAPRVYGASAGALVAAAVVCGSNIDRLREEILEFTRERPLGFPRFSLMEQVLRRTLPENAHLLACGRLHVSMTRVPDGSNILVSEFQSKEDLIGALLCSCFVPVFCGMFPPRYKGVHYIDGGLTNIQPVQDSCPTITVSPFAGQVDICPSDKSTVFCDLIINHLSVHASVPNFHRVADALFPRDCKALNRAFYNGYQDTLFFLQHSRSVRVYPDWVMQLKHVWLEDWLLPELEMSEGEGQEEQAEEPALKSPFQVVTEENSLAQIGTSALDPASHNNLPGQGLEVVICNFVAYLGMFSILTMYLPPRAIPYILLPLTILSWAITTLTNRVELFVLFAFHVGYWLCQHLKQMMWFVLSIIVLSVHKSLQHNFSLLPYHRMLTKEEPVPIGREAKLTASPSLSRKSSTLQAMSNLHALLFTLEMRRRQRGSMQDIP